jgi:hypothetical protein
MLNIGTWSLRLLTSADKDDFGECTWTWELGPPEEEHLLDWVSLVPSCHWITVLPIREPHRAGKRNVTRCFILRCEPVSRLYRPILHGRITWRWYYAPRCCNEHYFVFERSMVWISGRGHNQSERVFWGREGDVPQYIQEIMTQYLKIYHDRSFTTPNSLFIIILQLKAIWPTQPGKCT